VILIATIVVWFLSSFSFNLELLEDSQGSILATISGFVAPVLRPIGLDDWRIITSLVSGFMAKESVVSVMQTLFGVGGVGAIGTLSAITMLVFSLLYTPCVAAVSAIRRELGSKWAVSLVVWQCVLAWVVTLVVRLIAMAFGVR